MSLRLRIVLRLAVAILVGMVLFGFIGFPLSLWAFRPSAFPGFVETMGDGPLVIAAALLITAPMSILALVLGAVFPDRIARRPVRFVVGYGVLTWLIACVLFAQEKEFAPLAPHRFFSTLRWDDAALCAVAVLCVVGTFIALTWRARRRAGE